MKSLNILFFAAFLSLTGLTCPAHADELQSKTSQSESDFLQGDLEGVLGDQWSPYISVTGFYGPQPWGKAISASTDSESSEVVSLRFQSLAQMQLGAYISALGSPMRLRAGLGTSYSQAASAFGDLTFSSIFLELLPFYETEKFRVGVGLDQVVHARFDTSNNEGRSYNLGSPVGLVGEIGYKVTRANTWLNIRYEQVRYPVKTSENSILNGNLNEVSIGIGISFQLL